MMDGSGMNSAVEKKLDALAAPATGAPVPIVHAMQYYTAWLEMQRSFWRMFPLVAPFVPK